MELRYCGNSDLKLSVIGAGCWSFGGGDYWGPSDQQDATRIVHRSVELGINYFDTAEVYNDGRSEQALGEALKGINRESVIIGTKVSPSNCYPDTLAAHCHGSLQRLGTDYIDLYMIHWPLHSHAVRHVTDNEEIINNPPSISGALETLGKLRDAGKIRHIGVSNFAPSRLDEAQQFEDQIVVNQLAYNMLARAIEFEVLDYCKNHAVGIIGYSTLLQGVLADVYPALGDVPKWQRRTRHFHHASCDLSRHGEAGAEKEMVKALENIRSIARDSGITVPDLAVKWAIAQVGITCSLVGTRSVQRLETNVRATEEPLPAEIIEKLNTVTGPLKEKMGPSFDYFESTANDRTR